MNFGIAIYKDVDIKKNTGGEIRFFRKSYEKSFLYVLDHLAIKHFNQYLLSPVSAKFFPCWSSCYD
jgi:hypothetical protein